MKNFKHSFKSNNKMKLAAVASAAVMLAPVAMTSVSTFAFGSMNIKDSAGTYRTVDYPVYGSKNGSYNGEVVPVATAAALTTITNQNGTNGNVQSNGLGATVGFNTSDVEDAMATIASLTTTTSTNAGSYGAQAAKFSADGEKLHNAAYDLQKDIKTSGSIFSQLSADNQTKQLANANKIQSTYSALASAFHNAENAMNNAATKADSAAATAEAHPSATNQALADSTAATANATAEAYKAAAAKFSTLTSATKEFNTAIARQTNNGAVLEAAHEAALAIEKMDEGAGKKAAVAAFSKAQGDYLIATQKYVGDDQTGSHAQAVKNAAAIDAAAQAAVKALNDVAANAYTNKGTETVDPSTQTGVVKVNYPAGYGIQIWTKAGKAVRYNSVEAKQNGKKTGDAKKLPGQKSYKVFGSKYTANGTTYYNLGGDQYIDSAYVTFTAK